MSALPGRLDILRGALSTRWLDLRQKRSLTEYFESGASQAQRLHPFIRPDDSVLEYGVGIGRLAMHLRSLCREIAGCDINPLMIEYGNLLVPGVEFYLLDDLPPAPRFDLCYSVAVFFHLDPVVHDAALRYVHERLKPGGRFLVDLKLADRAKPVSRWRGSVSLADRDEFIGQCRRYFQVQEIKLFNDAFLLTKA